MKHRVMKKLVEQYYQGWAQQRLDQARAVLAHDLKFRSPQDSFDRADDFFNQCGHLSQNLQRVSFRTALYSESKNPDPKGQALG
ncbi:nuclear transport factor 2 family protein [candidate division CSSED10-310 bacterium]|uniref:Nuclear transport factor 2 family protein n=1 Tax=candidate division CSSED10-310 bacterium TaxID=2855610 RepID=A0ABV6Z6F2_UNCC1